MLFTNVILTARDHTKIIVFHRLPMLCISDRWYTLHHTIASLSHRKILMCWSTVWGWCYNQKILWCYCSPRWRVLLCESQCEADATANYFSDAVAPVFVAFEPLTKKVSTTLNYAWTKEIFLPLITKHGKIYFLSREHLCVWHPIWSWCHCQLFFRCCCSSFCGILVTDQESFNHS